LKIFNLSVYNEIIKHFPALTQDKS